MSSKVSKKKTKKLPNNWGKMASTKQEAWYRAGYIDGFRAAERQIIECLRGQFR